MDELPEGNIRELRRVIDGLLREQHVYSQIRNVLSDFAADADPCVPDAVLDVVRERGIIDSVLDTLSDRRPAAGPRQRLADSAASKRRLGGRFLHARLIGGRAFIENLDADPSVARRERLVVCACFGEQRFRSEAVESVCDPPFDADFLIDLDSEMERESHRLSRFGHTGAPDPTNRDLLRLDTKLHLVVLRVDSDRGSTQYVGENSVDWRSVLRQGGVSQEVQVGPLSVPAGILLLQLQLVPTPAAVALVTEDDLHQQRSAEATEQQAAAREFWAYARRWWQEYHAISPDFQSRHVKVYAEMLGPSNQKVPVVTLLTPLRCGRVLDSPFEAARFVSLLARESDDEPTRRGAAVTGDAPGQAWALPFTLLCRGKGSAAERAPLLCSLLLGFGLDAWVAMGVDRHGQPASWVLTRTAAADGPPAVTFWDLSGQRYHAAGPDDGNSGGHPFAEIHCVCSHQRFAASVARDASCDKTVYDFGDERAWKEMGPIKLRLLQPQHQPPLLPPPTTHFGDAEEEMEGALAECIARHRDALGLPTAWDQHRGYCMAQHLWKCEMERLTGQRMEDQTFASAVRNAIPPGSTFAAYPVHFLHRAPLRMLSRMVQDDRIKQVFELRGDDVRLTVRVKVFGYAEGAVSVWVMVAASCRKP